MIGLLLAGNAFGTLNVNLTQDNTLYSSGSSGEYNVVTTGASFVGNYAASAILNGGFQTFSIDGTGHSKRGASYSATLGSTTSATSGNEISIGTAYLYSQFAAGSLSGYNYDYGSGRISTARWLQKTFLALEGGISGKKVFVNKNPFYADLLTTFSTLSAAEADANGAYGVQVLQLLDSKGKAGRSQLVQTTYSSSLAAPHAVSSVPEPSTIVAGALLLLPFGISAIRILRRKYGVQPI